MKKLTALLLTILSLLSLVLAGCGSGSTASMDSATNGGAMAPGSAAESGKWDSADDFGFAEAPSDGSLYPSSDIYSDPDAKVIRTADLTIQTTEFEQSMAALAALTEELGGYYENARVNAGGYYDRYSNRTADYIVRIPKENFTAFRDNVGEVGHLYSISEDSQDVGEIYCDTEARLATLETKRDRLLALLEKAELMEDIISLENALAEVQYQIDMHTTALRKYDSLIDYSTFNIYLVEVVKVSTEPTPQDGFFTRLGASFLAGAEGFGAGLQSLALWIARNIIVLIILAVIVVVVVRILLRRRKKRNLPPEQ